MPPIVTDAPIVWHAFGKFLKLLRIHTHIVDEFRFMQQTLINSGIQFHMFSLPQEKVLKVIIHGLPHKVSPSDIIEELKNLGFIPTSCIPLQECEKRKVNVFFLKLIKVGITS